MDEIRYNQAQMKDDIAGIKNQMKVGQSMFNFTFPGMTRFICLSAWVHICSVPGVPVWLFDLI